MALMAQQTGTEEENGYQDHSVLGRVAECCPSHDIVDKRQKDERQAGYFLVYRAFAPEDQDRRNEGYRNKVDILYDGNVRSLVESLRVDPEGQRPEDIGQDDQDFHHQQAGNSFFRLRIIDHF